MTPERDVVVLFSGGRDSSLTACMLANDDHVVHLLTCATGATIGAELADYRYEELRRRFASRIAGRELIPIHGLFRRVALADIEADFQRFRKNLILLGAQLAMHTAAIVHCRAKNISCVASGFTTYEAHFPEQMPVAIQMIKQFMADFGIRYITPVYDYSSEDQVKYALLDFGITTKSLEGFSLFSDTFSDPSPELVQQYIEAKLPTCKQYIDFMSRSRK